MRCCGSVPGGSPSQLLPNSPSSAGLFGVWGHCVRPNRHRCKSPPRPLAARAHVVRVVHRPRGPGPGCSTPDARLDLVRSQPVPLSFVGQLSACGMLGVAPAGLIASNIPQSSRLDLPVKASSARRAPSQRGFSALHVCASSCCVKRVRTANRGARRQSRVSTLNEGPALGELARERRPEADRPAATSQPTSLQGACPLELREPTPGRGNGAAAGPSGNRPSRQSRCCEQNSVMTEAEVSAAFNDDGFDSARLVVSGGS
jgi:hypothetical protein